MQSKNKLQNDTASKMRTQIECKLIFYYIYVGVGDTNICFPSSVPIDDNLLTSAFTRSVPNDDAKFNYRWRS